MHDTISIIAGSDFVVSNLWQLGKFNNDYAAEVIQFNKMGYIGIKVRGNDNIVRRHLSDCEDIRSMTINSNIKNLMFDGKRWVLIHEGEELSSQDVYVVRIMGESGVPYYLSRTTSDSSITSDITKAWFTFSKEQALRYARRLSLTRMKPYECVKADDVIELHHYT